MDLVPLRAASLSPALCEMLIVNSDPGFNLRNLEQTLYQLLCCGISCTSEISRNAACLLEQIQLRAYGLEGVS